MYTHMHTHTYVPTYHTCIHTYIQTYIHRYIHVSYRFSVGCVGVCALFSVFAHARVVGKAVPIIAGVQGWFVVQGVEAWVCSEIKPW